MKTALGIIGAIAMLICADALWYPFPDEIRGIYLAALVATILATGFVAGYGIVSFIQRLVASLGDLR